MLIKKAYKYRIYPHKEQQHSLAIQFGHARFVYNHFRALREASYKETGEGLSYNLNFNTVGTTEIYAGGELVTRHSLKPEAALL